MFYSPAVTFQLQHFKCKGLSGYNYFTVHFYCLLNKIIFALYLSPSEIAANLPFFQEKNEEHYFLFNNNVNVAEKFSFFKERAL